MDEVRLLNALDRVERLKEESLWPFKQLKPQINPPRPKVQWDYMLEEIEWMSEDFWQERKWKKTMAYKFAHWCAEWHQTRDCGQFFEFGIFDGVLQNEIKEKTAPAKPEPVAKVETVKADHIEDTIDPLLLAPSSSEATSELRKLAEEQAKVSNSIPASIKLKVPKIPPMILDMETDHYFQSANHAALANVPTLTPPEFKTNAMYIESDSLVVCSQFMLADHYVETDKWDTIPEHPMKRLPGTQRYRSGPPKSTLFEPPPDYVADENLVPDILLGPDGHEITPPKVPRLSFVKSTEAWTKDEEDALWQLAMTYGYNWPLIELCLNSSHVGNVRHRTLWCCYEKLRDLAAMKFTPHSKGDYIYAPYQSNKKDKKVKVLGLLSTFNFISGLSKKRDAAKPAGNS